jgi:Ni,Fe-hydrogenase I cytochrome b subunit
MKTWHKIGILTLLVLIVAGIRIYFVGRERNTPAVTQKKAYQDWAPNADEVVPIRKM